MEATTRDLRLHTKEVLPATRRGEDVIITYRGERTARLVPVEEPRFRYVGRPSGAWCRRASSGSQKRQDLTQ